MVRTLLTVSVLALLSCAVWSQTGEPFKPGKLPKTEQAILKPGLTLRFMNEAGAAVDDVRRVRLAAFFLPAGAAPSPFVPPGAEYRVRLTGYVKAPIRQEYQFQLSARGSARLSVNDKSVLKAANETSALSDTIELARGYNKIDVDFTPPPAGEASFRVNWVGEGFNLEPLPPDALFSRGTDADLVAREQLREGRLLFATHQCQRCHGLPAGVAVTNDAMPELQQQAPSLEGAGSRFGVNWLVRWIQNPRELRPQATMPAVLHGAAAPQEAADIAAYLMTLKSEAAPANPPQGEVAAGEKIFRTLGCVACHHVNDPKEEELFDRLPLYVVNEKLPGEALKSFLKSPHKNYLWSRMPDFKLSDVEAEHLSAYIRDAAKGAMAAGP
ncbi:MAG: c-type cytochrome, partial [Planctomycetota bacterium]